MQEAAAVPLHAVRKMQQEFIQAQAAMTQQSLAVQQQALSQQEESLCVQQTLPAQLASAADSDPLRKLRQEDPQLPAFTGRTDHFLPWLLECQTRNEQRNLPDGVAIQYAIMAMGDILRGIFLGRKLSNVNNARECVGECSGECAMERSHRFWSN